MAWFVPELRQGALPATLTYRLVPIPGTARREASEILRFPLEKDRSLWELCKDPPRADVFT